ncbi:NlpC/P60 family protein (plasmid) [Streptomyces sp. NBC_01213]|uniref:C40 family peptidase n=1 Tax=Streptomyces sp. NBC_01213 TaxID=2903776 RepID=UPI002F9105D9|nr:NlpC/P60 family protein [Streptomyces sp. NBC_01213]
MNTIIKGALLALTGVAALVMVLLAGLISSTDADAIDDQGVQGVPAEYEPWIRRAVTACQYPELTPALMAAQIGQESGFRTGAGSHAGAQGPAQFVPGTWATWGRDADGNGRNDPHDIGDAVIAQGRLMCSLIGQAKKSTFRDDPRRLALAGYNAGWGAVQRFRGVPPITFADGETYHYVQIIMASIHKFQADSASTLTVPGSGSGPDALRRAGHYIGTPYSYGGGTPKGPSTGFCDGRNGYAGGRCAAESTVGFDCSSLVQYGYWTSVQLPRTAAAQYNATSDRPVTRGSLKPGDLVFWANQSGSIYHVGLYAGKGRVLHAPRTGRDVQVQPLDTAMPAADYHGATRP